MDSLISVHYRELLSYHKKTIMSSIYQLVPTRAISVTFNLKFSWVLVNVALDCISSPFLVKGQQQIRTIKYTMLITLLKRHSLCTIKRKFIKKISTSHPRCSFNETTCDFVSLTGHKASIYRPYPKSCLRQCWRGPWPEGSPVTGRPNNLVLQLG